MTVETEVIEGGLDQYLREVVMEDDSVEDDSSRTTCLHVLEKIGSIGLFLFMCLAILFLCIAGVGMLLLVLNDATEVPTKVSMILFFISLFFGIPCSFICAVFFSLLQNSRTIYRNRQER